MRDAAEATILVTGATDGLGRRVAQELAAMGAKVLLHGRSPQRLEATREELRSKTSSEKANSYLADLSSLAAVRDLAERILLEHDSLDVLVNNAGIIAPERKETEDGYELTLIVNYLSHFLLTRLLLPLLRHSCWSRATKP
jgi:NAD(P)-dependent dehydrogenase (short-subunit alcohol dehydrogenase family)